MLHIWMRGAFGNLYLLFSSPSFNVRTFSMLRTCMCSHTSAIHHGCAAIDHHHLVEVLNLVHPYAAIHQRHSPHLCVQVTLSKLKRACEKLERRAQAWSFVEKMQGAGSEDHKDEIKLSTVEGLIFVQVCVCV
jgi:hypothetical protein